MPVYSVNRRRAIVLLILSSVLLLTLDLRGNPFFDRVRSAFARVLQPFETAADVVATPIRNAWHGATNWQDLERENERLRDLIAQQRGDQLAARAIYSDYQELLTLNGLTARYLNVTARVVGGGPGNFEQTVEIDRGSADGIKTGMAVVNYAGLVGKITQVYSDRSVVRLITDSEYTIECKVASVNPDAAVTATDQSSTSTTSNLTPSGIDRADLSTTTTSTTTTTTVPATVGGGVPGQTDTTTASTVPGETTSTSSTTPPTTTIPPVVVERETGGCYGRGVDRLPAMRYVTENPVFGPIDEGSIVTTTGGSKSLAPPGILIGTVVNKVEGRGSAGPLLEIEPIVDLDHLNLVQVLLYVPPVEVPG